MLSFISIAKQKIVLSLFLNVVMLHIIKCYTIQAIPGHDCSNMSRDGGKEPVSEDTALLLIPYCLAMTVLLVTSTLFCLLLKDMLLTRHDTFSRARNSCTSVMTPLGSTFLFGGSPHNFMWPFALLDHLTKLLRALKLQTYLIRSLFLKLCKVHTCVAIQPNLFHTSYCQIILTKNTYRHKL